MITIEAGMSIFLAGQAMRGHVSSWLGWRTRQRRFILRNKLVYVLSSEAALL